MQRFKYQHFHKMGSVGVANLSFNSEKVDIIIYGDDRYIHKQIETEIEKAVIRRQE